MRVRGCFPRDYRPRGRRGRVSLGGLPALGLGLGVPQLSLGLKHLSALQARPDCCWGAGLPRGALGPAVVTDPAAAPSGAGVRGIFKGSLPKVGILEAARQFLIVSKGHNLRGKGPGPRSPGPGLLTVFDVRVQADYDRLAFDRRRSGDVAARARNAQRFSRAARFRLGIGVDRDYQFPGFDFCCHHAFCLSWLSCFFRARSAPGRVPGGDREGLGLGRGTQ